MDYWDLAHDAIEAMVAKKHPPYSANWSGIVPISTENGWGLTPERWSTEARIIINNFVERIDRPLEVPNSAIVTAGEKALDEFQAYLVAKAQIAPVRIAYYQTKAILAEWGE